ncbi:MAG: extracellular solute-binding protein [Spirochaetaceae bacterium]|jgi:ABC-type glycerol-3-phosphate transport system substrate-binding protein|nr:extracellular solute-binding protein [Spirochaetaceae bacterium]
MFHHKFKGFSYDKIIFVSALAVLLIALCLSPKEIFRITNTNLVLSLSFERLIEEDGFKEIIREFEGQNRTVSVKISNGNPDIMIFDPLFRETSCENQQIEDERTLVSGIIPLFYNISLLKRAGFDRPPKDREAFLSVCRKFKQDAGAAYAKGKYPFSFSDNIFYSVLPWFYAAGLRENNGESFNWTSRTAIETFSFLNTLNKEGLVDPASLENSQAIILDDFLAGKSAMMIRPVSDLKRIKKTKVPEDFNISTIPYPAEYKGKPVFNMSVLHIAVASDSIHKDQALLFVSFLEENRNKLAALTGIIPGSVSGTVSREQLSADKDPVLEKARILFEAADIIDDSKEFKEAENFERVFKDELKKMWRGAQSPSGCAAAIQKALL